MAAPASPGEDMDVEVEAFLASCAASAYGAAEALLRRLDAPASRAAARRLLGAVRRRFTDPAAGQDCLRAFNFRIRDVVLEPHLKGCPLPYTPVLAPHVFRLSGRQDPLILIPLHLARRSGIRS